MEEFNKLKHRDWKKKVSYQTTEEELEILKMDVTSKEEQDLVQSTLAAIEVKNTTEPSSEELSWLNEREAFLIKDIDEEAKYELCAIEIGRTVNVGNGIEFTGIFNYFINDGLNQIRF